MLDVRDTKMSKRNSMCLRGIYNVEWEGDKLSHTHTQSISCPLYSKYCEGETHGNGTQPYFLLARGSTTLSSHAAPSHSGNWSPTAWIEVSSAFDIGGFCTSPSAFVSSKCGKRWCKLHVPSFLPVGCEVMTATFGPGNTLWCLVLIKPSWESWRLPLKKMLSRGGQWISTYFFLSVSSNVDSVWNLSHVSWP